MQPPIDLGRRAVLRGTVAMPAALGISSAFWHSRTWADTAAALPDAPPELHFLRRTSFGVRPADLTRIRQIGIEAYREEQLNVSGSDGTTDTAARVLYPLAHLSGSAYWRAVYPIVIPILPKTGLVPNLDNSFDAWNKALREYENVEVHWDELRAQVANNALYRALYSKNQLFEVMVQFWSNHLNSYDAAFRGEEQLQVIRTHALGNFKAMVIASQRDTAMSRYLNNGDSRAPVANQNYARELLELHTLGEGRGYGQADVLALADILTGHTWSRDRTSNTFGQYKYEPSWHIGGDKQFLGGTIPSNGALEINAAIDRIFQMAECAEFIAYKLCRHFIADSPPAGIVQTVATTFRNSGYDIKAALREILKSAEFFSAADQKFMRPVECGIAALRAFDIHVSESLPASLVTFVADAGNRPFFWPTPDGYPDQGAFWASAAQFIARWNFAAAESQRNVPAESLLFNANGTTRASRRVANAAAVARDLVNTLADVLLHRPLRADHLEIVASYIGGGDPNRLLTAAEVRTQAGAAATILLASPYAQLR